MVNFVAYGFLGNAVFILLSSASLLCNCMDKCVLIVFVVGIFY